MELHDADYMKMALRLAKKGRGKTSPNPMVGAVIVKDGKIIGKGYHHFCGGPHAERDAIDNCSDSLEGATIYVTLEPCCHYGRTPPCSDYIIQHKFKRVVIGTGDPNSLVAGGGIRQLEAAGIDVTCNILQDKCIALNKFFFHYISNHVPFVTMKYAITADGKSGGNDEKKITGNDSLNRVHKDRSFYTAIMTGVGTVIADDPLLTCRIKNGKNPIRIICDTNLNTPLSSRIATTIHDARTIIATCSSNATKISDYRNAGFEILCVPQKDAHIDLNALMKELGKMNIDSVYLEAGCRLAYSALRSGIVNKLDVYIAPKLYPGSSQMPVMNDENLFVEAIQMSKPKVTKLGNDVLLEYELSNKCAGGIKCLQE